MWRTVAVVVLLAALSVGARGQWDPANPVVAVKQTADGAVLSLQNGAVRIQVLTPEIVRVTYAAGATFPETPQYIVTRTQFPAPQFTTQSSDAEFVLLTSRLKIAVTRKNSALRFSDASGAKLFEDDARSLTPVQVNGEKTFHAELFSNLWDSTEGFFGLGQHQAGVWNYHGESVELSQDNTNISVPMFLSSKGYGILWNNTSRSRFNNRFPHALYLSSEVADTVDYYFLYGPEFDAIVSSYRSLTGAAPLFGKWAYGFWQCKNKYESQAELLGVARKYRELHIPVDNIVQDWFWWNVMGDPTFNKNYSDPPGMIQELHDEHFHVMFSFWPYFRPGSAAYDEMDKKGFFVAKTQTAGFHPAGMALYDAFNPEARKYYWSLVDRGLFKIGADAWWLDTDEPETEARETSILVTNRVALGNGARYADLFPVMHTAGVYEGQRATSEQKRVFILSRSGFAGVQRNSVAAWSGDVESNWLSFARQIPAGLNFSLSGIPYWTTDIGGFIVGNPDDPAYRELFVRWFEYGAFCPIFRVHGTRVPNVNELWSYGPEAQKILTDYDRLRYRLLPYIYSVAWMTTNANYTPMRPMAMDFRGDLRALNTGDQFLFGPAILVNPVTQAGATTRSVYLPAGKWFDFWTGAAVVGGKQIVADAPLERMPLFVRAGSIVPMGPEMEYSSEKAADPIEVRIYAGANGNFTLYEDEGDSYDYERGAHAEIPLRWKDGERTLLIGGRVGSFPGMLAKRTFRLVLVGDGHGAGIGAADSAEKTVEYDGHEISASFMNNSK